MNEDTLSFPSIEWLLFRLEKKNTVNAVLPSKLVYDDLGSQNILILLEENL